MDRKEKERKKGERGEKIRGREWEAELGFREKKFLHRNQCN